MRTSFSSRPKTRSNTNMKLAENKTVALVIRDYNLFNV